MRNNSYAPHHAISRYSIREFKTGAEPFMVAMIIIILLLLYIRGYQILLTKYFDTRTNFIETMALFVDQLFVNFPHKSFPVIAIELYYQSIHGIWTLLHGNSSTLTTKLGGGYHSNIGIIMQDIF